MSKSKKEIILTSFLAIFSFLCWWLLKSVFYNNDYLIGHWALVIGVFILFGIVSCLAMLLIKNKKILFGGFAIGVLLFFVFFNNEPLYYLIVLVLLFLAFMFAFQKTNKEANARIGLDYFKILKRGLPILITALILLISVVYYFSPGLISKRDARISISDEIINSVLEPLEDKIGIGIINASKKTVYNLVDRQLNNLVEPFRYLIPLGLTIGLFVTLKIASILYMPIVIMLSWLILKILIAIKFVKFEKIQKEVETVSL